MGFFDSFFATKDFKKENPTLPTEKPKEAATEKPTGLVSGKEREALESAVETKRRELEQRQKDGHVSALSTTTRRLYGEFPIEANPGGSVRLASGGKKLYEVEVTGCLNGSPAVGLAAYYAPPAEVDL